MTSDSRLLDDLVKALARQAVDDYLASEAASGNDPGSPRPNPPALPDLDKAA